MTSYDYELFIKNKRGKLEHHGGYVAKNIEHLKTLMENEVGETAFKEDVKAVRSGKMQIRRYSEDVIDIIKNLEDLPKISKRKIPYIKVKF